MDCLDAFIDLAYLYNLNARYLSFFGILSPSNDVQYVYIYILQ